MRKLILLLALFSISFVISGSAHASLLSSFSTEGAINIEFSGWKDDFGNDINPDSGQYTFGLDLNAPSPYSQNGVQWGASTVRWNQELNAWQNIGTGIIDLKKGDIFNISYIVNAVAPGDKPIGWSEFLTIESWYESRLNYNMYATFEFTGGFSMEVIAGEAPGSEAQLRTNITEESPFGPTIVSEHLWDPVFAGVNTKTVNWSSGNSVFVQGGGGSSTPSNLIELNMIGEAVSVVPIPASLWLFVSGFVALMGFARRKKHIN